MWLWSYSLQTNAVVEPGGAVLLPALPKGELFLPVLKMVTLENLFLIHVETLNLYLL